MSFCARYLWVFIVILPSAVLGQPPGAAIYEKHCTECHGKNGEGVENEADDPLIGNKSIEWLTGRITRTMPEDNEKAVVGKQARQVAEYIYGAFYSPAARASQVRAELAHLTVRQFRASTTDLIASFRKDYNYGLSEEQGLEGKYYGTRSYRGDKKKIGTDHFVRVDPEVSFDYGTGTPEVPALKKLPAEEFSVIWGGSIMPPVTGEYEFVIRTRNGASLWVNNRADNDSSGQLIDGYVAPSNDVRELKAKIFLAADRPYPIELRFFKYKEEKASIQLLWKPPHGVLETIPKRHTRRYWRWESFVCDTPFPPDDRSFGYERGTNVSEAWLDAVTAGATQAAAYLVEHRRHYTGDHPDRPSEQETKLKQFSGQFIERAFRRRLSQPERDQLVAPIFAQVGDDFIEGLKRSVIFALTSPEFLYPEAALGDDQNAVASRLALVFWDSVPGRRLPNLAGQKRFKTQADIHKHADFMLWEPRTQAKLRGFFEHWLELEKLETLAKDKLRFPEFNPQVLADLRTSLDLFLHDTVWGRENNNYQSMLLSEDIYLNPSLAKIYGAKMPNSDFERIKVGGQARSGILTHPLMLTNLAYHDNTSPIHRGVFLTRNIVGMTLNPPPNANLFKDSDFDPNLTMREKVTELTKGKACMGCHATINPLGFALENFDGIGRWRKKENGKPINSRGTVTTNEGREIELKTARDIANYAAHDPAAHSAFIKQLFEHFTKMPPAAFGPNTVEELRVSWQNAGFWIPHLLKDVAATYALRDS